MEYVERLKVKPSRWPCRLYWLPITSGLNISVTCHLSFGFVSKPQNISFCCACWTFDLSHLFLHSMITPVHKDNSVGPCVYVISAVNLRPSRRFKYRRCLLSSVCTQRNGTWALAWITILPFSQSCGVRIPSRVVHYLLICMCTPTVVVCQPSRCLCQNWVCRLYRDAVLWYMHSTCCIM